MKIEKIEKIEKRRSRMKETRDLFVLSCDLGDCRKQIDQLAELCHEGLIVLQIL